MLENWIKLYISVINKSKVFFLWNILGLAIGMTSVILAFTYMKSEYSYNNWIPEKNSIYELNLEMGKQFNSIIIPAGVGPYLKEKELIDDYCYFGLEYIDFYSESKQHQGVINKILNTQKTFFNFFPYTFKYGDRSKVFEEEYTIAISSRLANKYFGDVNPIGDTLSLAHQVYKISGVYDLDSQSVMMPDVVLPNIEWNDKEDSTLWHENTGGLLLKSKQHDVTSRITEVLDNVYYEKRKLNKYEEEKGEEIHTRLIPLLETRFNSKQIDKLEGTTNKLALHLIVVCSLLVFLLTLLNYVNLNQANVLSRVKEFSVRRVIGASRVQLIFQIMLETVLNAVAALLLALTFIELSLPTYNSFLHQNLTFSLFVYWDLLVFILLMVICIGGIVPAFFASYISDYFNYKLVQTKSRFQVWRMLFVLVQIMVSFFFLFASGVIYSQIAFMQEKDRGFRGENVYQVKLYSQQVKRKLYRNPKVVDELKEIKGVDNVALSTIVFKKNTLNRNKIVYYKQMKITDFVIEGINESYLDMLEFEILGKKEGLDKDLPRVVVNKMFAQRLGMSPLEVLGEIISFDGNTFIIEAVINDFYRDGFEEQLKPMLLFNWEDIPFLSNSIEYASIKLESKNIDETLERIQSYWILNVDYEYPFEVITVDEQFANIFKQNVAQRNMFVLWNVAALLSALFGLYAVLSFIIERRLKEIAIRKILGASTLEIVKLITIPFVIVVTVGYMLVIYPSYLIMENWLAYFAYRIEISPLLFVYPFVILIVIIAFIMWIKLRGLVKGNLIEHIKYE